MSKYEILNLLNYFSKLDINGINCSNQLYESNLKVIFSFLKELSDTKMNLVESIIDSNFRFCDYYDVGTIVGSEIIEYFENNYLGEDKEQFAKLFALYVFLRNSLDFIMSFEMCDNYDELYEFLDNGSFFKDILAMVEYIKDKELINDDTGEDLIFLNPDNKYKILFTGTSYDDIRKLQKTFKKAFIKKISGQLCNSDFITLAEAVDHVKESYGMPIFRVQFGNDYRIAYLRKDGVTAILGVTIKSGKDKDYSRYDAVAKHEQEIYEEIEMLLDGTLPENSEHFRTIQHLQDFLAKIKEQ